MYALTRSERVVHPLFGLGTVLADEADGRVEVQFDEHDRKRSLIESRMPSFSGVRFLACGYVTDVSHASTDLPGSDENGRG